MPLGHYTSNFLVSIDVHCSCSQLLGLLLRDLSLFKSLKLIKTQKLNDLVGFFKMNYSDNVSKKYQDFLDAQCILNDFLYFIERIV